VQRELLPHVNEATRRVLEAEGYEVVAPADQPCCGALAMHAGEEDSAAALARRMVACFERAGADVIVSNAGGCGSHLKDYAHLLREDPAWSARAARFASKVRDVSELLASEPPQARYRPLPRRVAHHDSCHLQHAQRAGAAPRTMLARVPGLDVVSVPEPTICCGSAGLYNLVEPDTACALGDRKAALIAPLDAPIVATGNPGCLLHLQSALSRAGQDVQVVHAIELLDQALADDTDARDPEL
jgi:glycolate oxidase iron-sulfur subunit